MIATRNVGDIGGQGRDPVAGQFRQIGGVETPERQPVKSRQPSRGPDPEIAVLGLRERLDPDRPAARVPASRNVDGSLREGEEGHRGSSSLLPMVNLDRVPCRPKLPMSHERALTRRCADGVLKRK